MQLFSKQPKKEWLDQSWNGYVIWSEKVTDQGSPKALGEKIAKEVEKFDFPVVVALPNKLEVIGVNNATGRAGMWGFSLAVYWPANWKYDKQVVEIISSAISATGRLGSCGGKNYIKNNFSEVVPNLKDSKVWNCNFNAARQPASKKPPEIEKMAAENDLDGLCGATGYPDPAIQQAAIIAAIEVAGKINTREARQNLFDAILKNGKLQDVIGMFVRSQTVPGWRDLSYDSTEAVNAMGPEAVEFLLPLLDHPEQNYDYIRQTAVKVLGRSKDIRALKPILQLGVNYLLGSDKQDCAFACANLCKSNPDQYKDFYKEVTDAEQRDFLERVAGIAGKSDLLK